jgi:hypothetical protein
MAGDLNVRRQRIAGRRSWLRSRRRLLWGAAVQNENAGDDSRAPDYLWQGKDLPQDAPSEQGRDDRLRRSDDADHAGRQLLQALA